MKIPNPPQSAALMATARSFGNYDLSGALADLIDNSIQAHASRIEISFEVCARDIHVRIRDDGNGMNRKALIAAMRPASAHPESERSESDLGRFGWGLKSASLSQARQMTVVSWCEGRIYAARWDIDDIDDWGMDFLEGDEARNELINGENSESGTEVIWRKTDRLVSVENGVNTHDALTYLISQARESLSLVFHRYLSGEQGSKLEILINGNPLVEVDPFMTGHPATQTLDAETIEMSNGARLKLQPYVLPHFSKLTSSEQRQLGGAEGMAKNQGFYVYRNFRLIIHGTWFKLIPHRDISQLTRVRVDLPNSLDHEWRITLDKSGAQLPSELKSRLRDVARKFNRKSKSAHRRKGVSIDRNDRTPIWLRSVKNGQIKYRINRDHPVIDSLLGTGEDRDGGPELLLTLLESYFPTDNFLSDLSAQDSKVNQTVTDNEDFDSIILQSIISYTRNHEGPHKAEEFLEFIRNVEPFASHWKYSEEFVRSKASTILE